MGRRFVRGASGGAAIIVSLSGLLFSCSAVEKPSNQSAASGAAGASQQFELSDNFGVFDLEQRFEAVTRHVAPAVVAISATDAKLETDQGLQADRFNSEKLAAMLATVDRTVGTGFIVDPDGYIVTNDHVVANNEHIWVTTDDHHVYPAIVVGSDPRADVAVLKIPAGKLPTIRFAAAPAKRGQWTMALGNPYGLAGGGEMAVSVGIVSATGRSLPKLSSHEERLYCDLIQTTAQINPGNSGGPLFDLRGEVIGINAAVILPQKVTNGIGFAIPVTRHLRQVIDDLKQGREVVYGFLGVRVTSLTPLERKEAGLTEEGGAKVESVDANSPASAKLKAGDTIVNFNGEAVNDGDHFVRLVGEAQIDREVKAVVYRGGKPMSISIATTRRQSPLAAVTRDSQRMRWRGMLLGPIPQHWIFGSAPKPATGLIVIAIDEKSPFAKGGVVEGSVIATVAGKPVGDILQLQRIVNETPPEACAIVFSRTAGQVVSVQE
ncbi:MAG TPA: trypsin-like peptidase domain-containing protein [Tepidisphaeraceae bacterium]|jgi:S1-C subfamily serine protease|nr:trypsin-like peptidase domain-containing protein [Tepidisphaeraceae bacterium]